MKVPYVNYGKNFLNIREEVLEVISNSLSRGDVILRDDVFRLENSFAKYIGAKYAIGLNSGTDAIMLALISLDMHKGSDVITVSHTCPATINAIIHAGFNPVCIDVGDDFNMDTNKIEEAITSNTVAILPVHLAGRCCNILHITDIVSRYGGIKIVEDSCQSVGSEFFGKRAGSFGDIGCFSFHPMKILGAYGDAGAVVTNDYKLAEQIRLLRRGEMSNTSKSFGYNSKLDNIQAAILNVKLKYLGAYIERRRQIARIYIDELKNIEHINLQKGFDDQNRFDTFYSFTIRVNNGMRNTLKYYLEQHDVETMIYWTPSVHKVLGIAVGDLKNTEKLSEDSLSLPMYPELDDSQLYHVVKTIKEFSRLK